MVRRKKGGVHTQKVSITLGIIALLMMGALVCCGTVAADESEEVVTVNVVPESDFCGVSLSLDYVLSGDSSYYFTVELLDSEDSSVGTVSPGYGTLYGTGNTYTISVTAPSTAGDYRFVAKFYKDSTKEAVLAEKTVPLKVVEAIKLSFTLKNDGSSDVTFSAYFKINGEKVDDSTQTVTVQANNTKEVTYDYYVKDVSDTRYSLESDNEIVMSSIGGLGEEKTFYASDADYTMITTLVVVILVIMLVVLFFIYRKPVVNTGKPKGRR